MLGNINMRITLWATIALSTLVTSTEEKVAYRKSEEGNLHKQIFGQHLHRRARRSVLSYGIEQETSISSPRLDNGEYDVDADVTWTVTTPDDKRPLLTFTYFSLEPQRGCSYDKVEIEDAQGTLGVFCGTSPSCSNFPQARILSRTPSMVVKFSSDISVTYKGFDANITFVDENWLTSPVRTLRRRRRSADEESEKSSQADDTSDHVSTIEDRATFTTTAGMNTQPPILLETTEVTTSSEAPITSATAETESVMKQNADKAKSAPDDEGVTPSKMHDDTVTLDTTTVKKSKIPRSKDEVATTTAESGIESETTPLTVSKDSKTSAIELDEDSTIAETTSSGLDISSPNTRVSTLKEDDMSTITVLPSREMLTQTDTSETSQVSESIAPESSTPSEFGALTESLRQGNDTELSTITSVEPTETSSAETGYTELSDSQTNDSTVDNQPDSTTESLTISEISTSVPDIDLETSEVQTTPHESATTSESAALTTSIPTTDSTSTVQTTPTTESTGTNTEESTNTVPNTSTSTVPSSSTPTTAVPSTSTSTTIQTTASAPTTTEPSTSTASTSTKSTTLTTTSTATTMTRTTSTTTEAEPTVHPRLVHLPRYETDLVCEDDQIVSSPDEQEDTSLCGGTLTAGQDAGTFSSPQFGEDDNAQYPGGMTCEWTISADLNSQVVVLRFVFFALEHHANCGYDYVTVTTDVTNPMAEGSTTKLCGTGTNCQNYPRVTYVSHGSQMRVTFTSDSSNNYRGFQAQYYSRAVGHAAEDNIPQSPPGQNCLWVQPTLAPSVGPSVSRGCSSMIRPNPLEIFGVPLTNRSGVYYSNNQNCTWSLETPSNTWIDLKFSTFNVEQGSSGCNYDAVEVYHKNWTLLDQFCGQLGSRFLKAPKSDGLLYKGNALFVTFRSDSSVTSTGFKANYQPIPQRATPAPSPTPSPTSTAQTSTPPPTSTLPPISTPPPT